MATIEHPPKELGGDVGYDMANYAIAQAVEPGFDPLEADFVRLGLAFQLTALRSRGDYTISQRFGGIGSFVASSVLEAKFSDLVHIHFPADPDDDKTETRNFKSHIIMLGQINYRTPDIEPVSYAARIKIDNWTASPTGYRFWAWPHSK